MSSNLIKVPGQPEVTAEPGKLMLTAEQIQESIGPWLPRLQLFSSNSDAVKQKVVPAGMWGIPVSSTLILQLGDEVDVVLVASRDKAMQWDGEEMHTSTVKDSDLYKRLKVLSDTDGDSGAMYGTEFLTWIGSLQMFASLFLGSKSARRESLAFMQQVNKPAQLFSRLIGTKRKWEIPQVKQTNAFPFDLPDETTVNIAWKKFTEPDKEEGEAVADTPADGSRVR